jgi:hypothetical protein
MNTLSCRVQRVRCARPCRAAVKYSKKYTYSKYKYPKKTEEVFQAANTYTTFGSIPGRGLQYSTVELNLIHF